MFVFVTRFTRADGTDLVHAYGPYADRYTAHTAKREAIADVTPLLKPGEQFNAHTCKILDVAAMNAALNEQAAS